MKPERRFKHILIVFALIVIVSPVNAQNLKKNPTKLITVKSPVNVKQKDGVYDVVDVLPKFPGGKKAFGDYLIKNIKYPAIDKKNKLEGKVFMQFVVERDGSLSKINAVRSPSKAMSDEAARVLKASPKWNPGIMNNKPVRALYTLPINFDLPG